MVRDVLVEDDGSVGDDRAHRRRLPASRLLPEQVSRFVACVTRVRLGFDVMSSEEKAALVSRLRGGRTDERTISLAPGTRASSRSPRGRAVSANRRSPPTSRSRSARRAGRRARRRRLQALDPAHAGNPPEADRRRRDDRAARPRRLKLMSIGFFLEENAPIMWRGPMLHKALEQFLSDVWGRLDTLLVDMPPGPGTWPCRSANSSARRGPRGHDAAARGTAGRRAGGADGSEDGDARDRRGREHVVPRRHGPGVVRVQGGQALADEIVPLLARIPLDPPLREAADDGCTVLEVAPDSESA